MTVAATELASPAEPEADRPSLQIGRRRYTVVLPTLRDPRIHLSIVTITLFVIGIGWLEFRLSIAQILAAMIPCALIDLAIAFRRTSMIVWPASALQTAASVALLLRVEGTASGDLWTFRGWYYFAGVAAFGLVTKHIVRYRGGHVFNPSNIALVVAFLVIGSSRIEPLDLWWGPLDLPMVIAYGVIIGGGLFICRGLRLIEMGIAFWLTFAVGVGVLAILDHSITARWSLAPIAGTHFWWIVLTSPETLIFLFFMLTDPRTIPAGRSARIVFAVVVGVLASLLIAPWETEFGAKVGLLTSLALVSAARPLLERALPAPGSHLDDPRHLARRILLGDSHRVRGGRTILRVTAGVVSLVVFGAGVAVASLPSRLPPEAQLTAVDRVPAIDPNALPVVVVDRHIANLSDHLATQDGAQELAALMAWNLAVEHEALRTRDSSLLAAVDHGYRLDQLEQAIAETGSADSIYAPIYEFDALRLLVVFPGGAQEGPNAGFVATGTQVDVEYSEAGVELARSEQPFGMTFALRQTASGRWQITDTLAVPK